MTESFMRKVDFSGKSVAVVGFGLEGRSACDFLLARGASVTVFDERGGEHFEEEEIVSYEEQGVVFEFLSLGPLVSFEVVVRSPGVSVLRHEIQEAIEAGVVVTSSTKIFFDLCPAKIIGVTGTKGKGTTSTLIFEILKRSGRDAYLAGNIGEPMLSLLPVLTPESLVVLELSSFQLSDLHRSPHIAVMLMVVPEHMDYHADFSEYLEAKRNLIRFQTPSDYAIFNHDYPASNESDVHTAGKIFYTSREDEVLEGCFVKDDWIVVRGNFSQTQNSNLKIQNSEEKIIRISEIRLVGKHNLDNVCAGILVAKILKVPNPDIVHVLKEFGGLPHRLELVREVDGVAYYNDSFSTIPETTIAAIEAFEQPKILILGGSSKNSNFEELGRVIRESQIRGIVGIGEEWSRMRDHIQLKVQNEKLKIVERKTSMKDIVEAARDMAESGDVVLLSPACASFGMFKNYKQRGDQFREEVNKLI